MGANLLAAVMVILPLGAVGESPAAEMAAFAPPAFKDCYPPGADLPVWDLSDLNILCVVQIMDGLGRKQAAEIDHLMKTRDRPFSIALFAIDRDNEEWPRDYIGDTWNRMKLSVPVFDLGPGERRALFKGFDPKRILVLPQVLFFSKSRSLLRILEGFHTAAQIRREMESVRAWKNLPIPVGVTAHPVPGFTNGGFKDWQAGEPAPSGWQIWSISHENKSVQSTHPDQTGVELTVLPGRSRQILYQRLAQPELLLGKKVRLSAEGASNAIGRPVVALAVAQPLVGRFRFAPESPFVDRDGHRIPLRILGACDFADKTSAWQVLNQDIVFPDQGKVFVILAYLENAEDPGARAILSQVSLEIIE